MSDSICGCSHSFDDHGFKKNENNEFKRPCEKCECENFQRPGAPRVATAEARVADQRAEAELYETKMTTKEIWAEMEKVKKKCKGPFFDGTYWSKKNYESKWKTHSLTKMLTSNKDGLLTEDLLERLSDIMYKTLEQNTEPDNIEIIVPVPNHLRHSDSCESSCKIDKPNENAPPLAKALAAMICKKRNRKNCQTYDDVLVRFLKSDPYRKQAGVESRYKSANSDYRIAEHIIRNNHLIKDQIVLLIDDIKTSGATLQVCAKLLMDYGAKQVIILCVAETKSG